jgi:hypothetical protein
LWVRVDGDLALARSPFGLDAVDDYCAFGCFVSEAAPELEVPFFFFFFFFGALDAISTVAGATMLAANVASDVVAAEGVTVRSTTSGPPEGPLFCLNGHPTGRNEPFCIRLYFNRECRASQPGS